MSIDNQLTGNLLGGPLLSAYLMLFCKEYTIDIEKLEYKEIDGSECRIYYYIEESIYGYKLNHPGFYFIVLEVVAYLPEAGVWGNETEVKVICKGEARFDGVRHIWFGNYTDNNGKGYLYYQSPYLMKLVMEELMRLEDKFCDPKSLSR